MFATLLSTIKNTDGWDELDLDGSYNLAGYNYTLRDLGGGFARLNGAANVLDYVMEDYMVLANYIKGFENGIVGAAELGRYLEKIVPRLYAAPARRAAPLHHNARFIEEPVATGAPQA